MKMNNLPRMKSQRCSLRDSGFAADSSLEEAGFEPSADNQNLGIFPRTLRLLRLSPPQFGYYGWILWREHRRCVTFSFGTVPTGCGNPSRRLCKPPSGVVNI